MTEPESLPGDPLLENASVRPERTPQADLRRRRWLAIVTGAISVLVGILYLVLIALLDSRGPLQPPPPEAMGLTPMTRPDPRERSVPATSSSNDDPSPQPGQTSGVSSADSPSQRGAAVTGGLVSRVAQPG